MTVRPTAATSAGGGRGPRPTPVGWAVLATCGVLLGGGWAIGHPEPVALGVTGLAAVAVALVGTLPSPRLTAERRLSPTRVARGDRAGGVVSVTNLGARPCRGLVVEDHCDGAVVSVRLPPLPAGATVRADYAVPTNRRGHVPVGPLRLVRRDVFGLAYRSMPIGAAVTLMVHPRLHPVGLPPSGREHHLEGPTSDSANEGTMTFHTLRDYVEGDDLRRVHWRATARTGTLMVRQMADVSMPVTTLLLDTRHASYAGPHSGADFELAVDVAASVGYAASSRHFPLRVCTGSHAAGQSGGVSGRRVDNAELLAHFSEIRADDEGFTRALDQVRRAGAGGLLAVVTGWAETDVAGRIAGAARNHEHAVIVHVGERPTDTPTPSGGIRRAAVAELADVARLWPGAKR
ncbi:MAG TPA: DUF58 domain-containing protein [Yinghuangia sp.]|uniref:DUF58 domain-containing protein n=1 Tax=Yinghuangia sp. YIM S10712 TaxID=3436930 RepID=UPI002C8C7FDF|nr:DUF58 domain-containing protein [Yinghuangia sp.]